jgi:arylsulfatase A-like enzyme
VLKGAGYATACIGKWGLQGSGSSPATWPAYPLNRGFDFYYGYVGHGDGHEHYPKEGTYGGPKQVWDNLTEVSSTLDKCYTADLWTARTKKWIVDQRAANPAQPFFLYLSYDTPHAVLELPTQAYPAGGGLTGGLQWNGTPGAMINTASGTVDSYTHPSYATATWDDDANAATPEVAWPDVYKRFATDVRRIDDCVGDVLKLLQDLGIDNNTLVIFTSDNGPSRESYLVEAYEPTFFNSFGPFDGVKRDCWEGGIRVGALARWPAGIPANRTTLAPSQTHDWLPTFAELAGVPVPARTDGVSLLPTLSGTGVQKPSTIYVEYFEGGTTPSFGEFQAAKRGRSRNQMQTIRIGDYVGVRYNVLSHADAFEIYDIVANPKQTTNLAGSNAALQQQMKDKVLRLRRPDASAPRTYDSEAMPPLTPSPTTNGVDWRAYTQAFPWVPKLEDLTHSSGGTTTRPDLAVRPRDNDIGMLYSGYLSVPADGDYTLYLTVDTAALLRIHEATVIDSDFAHTGGTEDSGTIKLKAGKHPFRLYYRRGTVGTPALSLQWSGPGIAKQPVPDGAFFRDGVGAGSPPVAFDDAATTPQATAVDIAVLANDTDDGTPAPLFVQSIGTPQRGTVALVGNAIRYTPDATFLGTDAFTYTVSDGAQTSTATVRVAVTYSDGDFWFPFNQTSGLVTYEAGGQPATLTGFTNNPAQWVAGKSNRGLQFDGVDDFVSVDNFTGVLGTGARTCAAWVKTTSTGINRPIIAWGPNSNGNKWTFLMTTAGVIRAEITAGFVVGTRTINDGQWHHVACTFANDGTPNATDVKLYVDGTLETISTSTAFALNTSASGNVKIGGDIQGRFWSGNIDDARIYRRALSATEITTLAATPETSSLAWHRRYLGNTAVNWLADDEGDGFPRLLEYALGGQPQWREDALYDSPFIATDRFRWSIPQRKAGTHNLTYIVEASRDLLDWTIPVALVGTTSLDAEFDLATYEATPAVSTEPRLFFRLRVF